MKKTKPSVFIGSSTEGDRVSKAIQVLLDSTCEVEIWNQGVFGLSQGTLESLVLALNRFDFAILVLTADDLVLKRERIAASPRDNVVFELGLFVGGLGRDRTFMVYDRDDPPSLPSDLAGITPATYAQHSSGNLQAALGAASTKIENAIERLGLRDSAQLRSISNAATNIEDVSDIMQNLVRLLARSRKVELDIISEQFGPAISPDRLSEIQEDLRSLEAVLEQTRPIVTAVVETAKGGNEAIAYNLVIANTGGTPAYDVQLSVDHEALRACLGNGDESPLLEQVLSCFDDAGRIAVLRNGERRANSFGFTKRHSRDSTWKAGSSFPLEISYRGERGSQFRNSMEVIIKDSSGFAGGSWKTT